MSFLIWFNKIIRQENREFSTLPHRSTLFPHHKKIIHHALNGAFRLLVMAMGDQYRYTYNCVRCFSKCVHFRWQHRLIYILLRAIDLSFEFIIAPLSMYVVWDVGCSTHTHVYNMIWLSKYKCERINFAKREISVEEY